MNKFMRSCFNSGSRRCCFRFSRLRFSFLNKMDKKIITVDEALGCLGRIKELLKAGGVIAVPTDTIYGIACLACNTKSLERIYEIKSRDLGKPLAMCVGEVQDLQNWSHVTVDEETLNTLLPGPVTLIFDRRDTLPKELNPGVVNVGIRIPDYKFIIELSKHCNEPIALTSANVSNEPSSLKISEFQSLWDKLDLVVDGGTLGEDPKCKAGSTIIDLTVKGQYKINRNGSHYEEVVEKLENKCKLVRRS